MIAGSALLTDDNVSPQLVTQAVRRALNQAGLTQAGEVILFLSPEFARHATAAVTAASHAAGCLQVFGGIAAGVVSDEGWAMDRPAVAVLVIGDLPKTPATQANPSPLLSLCGTLHLPEGWLEGQPRTGLLYADSLSSLPTPVWQGARISGAAELQLAGCNIDLAVSTGVELRPERLRVEASAANEIIRVLELPDASSPDVAKNPATMGLGLPETACASLKRILPVALRGQRPLPIHLASAALHAAHGNTEPRLIPILSANADGSITLSETLPPGSVISWALRLPAGTEADMRHALDGLQRVSNRHTTPPPAFGIFLSCIGRGPFFFAGEDRDLNAFRDAYPGMPFVGAYGSGQIAPATNGNTLLQNTVIVALARPLQ